MSALYGYKGGFEDPAKGTVKIEKEQPLNDRVMVHRFFLSNIGIR